MWEKFDEVKFYVLKLWCSKSFLYLKIDVVKIWWNPNKNSPSNRWGVKET